MQILRPFALDFDAYTVSLLEDDPDDWLIGTTYDLGDQVIRDHRVWVSAIASNTGNDPALENQNLTSAKWLYVSHTNAYRFMDETLGNLTTATSEFTIAVTGVAGADAIMFFGMKASAISVEAFNPSDATVYEETVSFSGRDVFTFYQWFTEPLGETKYIGVVTDLPSTTDHILITISGTDIEVGEIVIGELITLGTTVRRLCGGRTRNYSRNEFNAYGNLTKIKGPTRSIMDYGFLCEDEVFPTVKTILDRLAGDLVGAIGSPSRQSTIHLGLLGTIEWDESLPDHYIAQFSVEGVT